MSCKTKHGMKFGDGAVQDWKFRWWWSLNRIFSCGRGVTKLNSVGWFGLFLGYLLVKKEHRRCVREEDPSPSALVAGWRRVKVAAGGMASGGGHHVVHWGFVVVGPGGWFQVSVTGRKALQEESKSTRKETNLSSWLSLPSYNPVLLCLHVVSRAVRFSEDGCLSVSRAARIRACLA